MGAGQYRERSTSVERDPRLRFVVKLSLRVLEMRTRIIRLWKSRRYQEYSMDDENYQVPDDIEVEEEEDFDISQPIVARVRLVDTATSSVQFSNHVTSQFTGDEFILTFAQVVPPSGAELTLEEFREITHVDARVVCRVGLSPTRMAQLLDVVQRNYAKYQERYGFDDEEEGKE